MFSLSHPYQNSDVHVTVVFMCLIGKCCDEGKSYLTEVPDSPATKAFMEIIESKSLLI